MCCDQGNTDANHEQNETDETQDTQQSPHPQRKQHSMSTVTAKFDKDLNPPPRPTREIQHKISKLRKLVNPVINQMHKTKIKSNTQQYHPQRNKLSQKSQKHRKYWNPFIRQNKSNNNH